MTGHIDDALTVSQAVSRLPLDMKRTEMKAHRQIVARAKPLVDELSIHWHRFAF